MRGDKIVLAGYLSLRNIFSDNLTSSPSERIIENLTMVLS